MRKLKPVFARALDCFDTRVEFGRQVGETKQVINYWCQIGYVPPAHALKVSNATAGKVAVMELLNEANREITRLRVLRDQRKAAKELAAIEQGAVVDGGA